MSPCLSIRHNGHTIDDHEKTSISIIHSTDMIEMTLTTYATTIPANTTTTTNTDPPNKPVLIQTITAPPALPLRTTTNDHHIIGHPYTLHAPMCASSSNAASASDTNHSINSLMLSTSVPIKIGTKIDNIDRDANHKSNRIRYTFGLNTRKKSTSNASDASKRTPTKLNNHKSMESIASMATDARKSPSNLNHTSSESLALQCMSSSNATTIDTNEFVDANQFKANRNVFVSTINDRGSKLVKQTTIDYYV